VVSRENLGSAHGDGCGCATTGNATKLFEVEKPKFVYRLKIVYEEQSEQSYLLKECEKKRSEGGEGRVNRVIY
jgi:hypothetical protein